jgi:phenylalanyl-tRNA synthetase beta chain
VDVGLAGQLAPTLAEARDLPGHEPVFIGEIDLDLVAPDYASDRLVLMTPLPRHPSVVRDVSLLVRADLPAADVRGTMQAAAPETLVRVTEFDRFVGPSLPEGMVSLSFRLTFRHADRTLTDAEVQAAMETILAAVHTAHGATLR